MSLIDIIKFDQTEQSTVSKCYINGQYICFIIEDGEREEKIPGLTRIPAGEYRLKQRRYGRFYTRYRQRYGHLWVWEIENVPNFTDILVHIGNTISETRGCLLPNKKIEFDGKNWRGWESARAYEATYEALEGESEHRIRIIR